MMLVGNAQMGELRFLCNGLPEGDIVVGDIKDEVPESLVCRYFGKKSSKSGWKYDAETTPEEQSSILSLYQRVYEVEHMPNKEITLQFARGLILMSLGRSVNWKQFSVERRQYREGLRAKRELSKTESEKDADGSGVSAGNLKKRRCFAAASVEFPTSLSLSPKVECGEGLVLVGKKGSGVGKKIGSVSTSWSKDDCKNMQGVIEKRVERLKLCEHSLSAVSRQREAVEVKLRRARMLFSDREMMVSEAETTLLQLCKDELSLRAQIEEGSLNSRNLDSIKALKDQLDILLFKKTCNERIARLSGEEIRDCESNIAILEQELEERSCEEINLKRKVKALNGMNTQLQVMSEGGGAVFWPRPLADSPDLPLILTHTLNACPVCCLWYSCFDYVPLSCGHCYHPWCLYEHTKISKSCMVNGCGADLHGPHGVALGLRPSTNSTITSPEAGKVAEETRCMPAIPVHQATANHSEGCPIQKSGDSEIILSNSDGLNKHIPMSHLTNPRPYVAINREEPTTLMCWVCDARPAAMKLQKCGHAIFCFGCIQGKADCPFCFEKISGWDPLPIARRSISALPSLGVPQKLAAKAATVDKRTNLAKEVVEAHTPMLPSLKEAEANNQHPESDSDGLDSDDEFKDGGTRTVIPVSDCARSLDQSLPPFVTDQGKADNLSKVFLRKKRSCDRVDTLNHTRIVSKPLSELLNLPIELDVAQKGEGGTGIQGPILKGRGRPPATNSMPVSSEERHEGRLRQSTGRVKAVPARLKDSGK